MRLASVALLVLVPSCTIYFGDDNPGDDIADDDCLGPPAEELRDPQSGQCQAFGGGCVPVDEPDWATCFGPCDGLDEATCEATSACRAILFDECPACDALVLAYGGCWGTAPSGPIEGGDCNGLDAQTCSQHDDCMAVYADDSTGQFTGFEWCQPEVSPAPLQCGDVTCAAGQYCQAFYGGPVGGNPTFTCTDYPSACSPDPATACDCLANNGACGNDCAIDSSGNVTVTCYAP